MKNKGIYVILQKYKSFYANYVKYKSNFPSLLGVKV
jgi:hypothetical protein